LQNDALVSLDLDTDLLIFTDEKNCPKRNNFQKLQLYFLWQKMLLQTCVLEETGTILKCQHQQAFPFNLCLIECKLITSTFSRQQ
jgi:hypothetical protein